MIIFGLFLKDLIPTCGIFAARLQQASLIRESDVAQLASPVAVFVSTPANLQSSLAFS